uniref:Bifunctional lysine-specific demethylase and histidyl-hydroxylase n=1 Tax=Parastrongyloides trichosuri TaxID=131310 RepID=A0A0N4ZAJ7_PARTI
MKRKASKNGSFSNRYQKNTKKQCLNSSDSENSVDFFNQSTSPVENMPVRKIKKTVLLSDSDDSEIEMRRKSRKCSMAVETKNGLLNGKTKAINNITNGKTKSKVEDDEEIIELKREDAIFEEHESSDDDEDLIELEDEEDFEDEELYEDSMFFDAAEEINDSDIEEPSGSEPSDFEDLADTEEQDNAEYEANRSLIYDPPFAEGEEDEEEDEDEIISKTGDLSKDDIVVKDIKKLEKDLFTKCDVYQHTCDLSQYEIPNIKKLPFSSKDDSTEDGRKAFQWLVEGIPLIDFLKDMYGVKCVNIKRNNKYYYGNLFSLDSFYKMLETNDLEYERNINIALYKDGVRTTHNGKGKVASKDVKKALSEGKSAQCINPQSYNNNIWYICDLLQEYTNAFAGANNYITPAKSSGFAAHYDDIDAFLLQLEGRKFWTVWKPSNVSEMFPLESSGNFKEEELDESKIIFQGWLEQGDLLYIPRGFIHQAKTDSKNISHHLTISLSRENSFITMYQKIAPTIIENMMVSFPFFRRSLPPNYFSYMGVADTLIQDSNGFVKNIANTLTAASTIFNTLFIENLDSAADNMSKEYFIRALPPKLTKSEKKHSVVSEKESNETPFKLTLTSCVRIIRRHTQRLLFDGEGGSYIIHRMNNSRTLEYQGEQTIGVPADLCPVFETIVREYPNHISVRKALKSNNVKHGEGLEFLQKLYDAGILLVENKF